LQANFPEASLSLHLSYPYVYESSSIDYECFQSDYFPRFTETYDVDDGNDKDEGFGTSEDLRKLQLQEQ
jgi:hypothetical protein